MPEYGSKSYWEERYATSGTNLFDWYMDYDGVLPSCVPYLEPESRVLVIGCGNSNLSEMLYDDGYKRVTSIDYSEVAISLMSTRSVNTRPELKYLVMDATSMSTIKAAEFDVIIDKGTMDSMFCLPTPAASITNYLREANRVLKPGGKLLVFSFGNPGDRIDYLDKVQWGEMNVHVLPKPTLKDLRDGVKDDYSPKEYNPVSVNPSHVHFVYTLTTVGDEKAS